MNELLNIISNYFEGIVETSLKYIPDDKKIEFLVNCSYLTEIHKLEVKTYIEQKNKKVKQK